MRDEGMWDAAARKYSGTILRCLFGKGVFFPIQRYLGRPLSTTNVAHRSLAATGHPEALHVALVEHLQLERHHGDD